MSIENALKTINDKVKEIDDKFDKIIELDFISIIHFGDFDGNGMILSFYELGFTDLSGWRHHPYRVQKNFNKLRYTKKHFDGRVEEISFEEIFEKCSPKTKEKILFNLDLFR